MHLPAETCYLSGVSSTRLLNHDVILFIFNFDVEVIIIVVIVVHELFIIFLIILVTAATHPGIEPEADTDKADYTEQPPEPYLGVDRCIFFEIDKLIIHLQIRGHRSIDRRRLHHRKLALQFVDLLLDNQAEALDLFL